MKASDIPVKFQIPFANAAGSGYINPIPQASQIGVKTGAASLTDGFPPLAFVQPSAGGAGPFGTDFNGLLNQITAWNRWQNSGGTVTYDATFSTAIGGYPLGATLASTTAGKLWISTVDDNTSNPDAAGLGWVSVQHAPVFELAPTLTTGTATAYDLTPSPAITAYETGQVFTANLHIDSGASPTLNVSGLGAKPIAVNSGGTTSAPAAGTLKADRNVVFVYDGTSFVVVGNQWALNGDTTGQGLMTDPAFVHAAVLAPGYQTAAQVEAAIDALVAQGTWQDVSASRSVGTSYQNSTGKPIWIAIAANNGQTQISTDNSTWVIVSPIVTSGIQAPSFIVAPGEYYRCSGGTIITWVERR